MGGWNIHTNFVDICLACCTCKWLVNEKKLYHKRNKINVKYKWMWLICMSEMHYKTLLHKTSDESYNICSDYLYRHLGISKWLATSLLYSCMTVSDNWFKILTLVPLFQNFMICSLRYLVEKSVNIANFHKSYSSSFLTTLE